jgi:MFS family permease
VAAGFLVAQQLVGDGGDTVYAITEQTVRQATVENRLLGRTASTIQVASGAAQLAATLAAGLLAEVIGLRAVAVMAPLGALAGAAVIWFSPVRSLRIHELEVSAVDALEGSVAERPVGG